MPTFVDIASGDSNFSILVAALGFIDANLPGSNLVQTLNDPSADLTVFAPTNAAFGQLAADLGYAGDPADASAVTSFLVTNVPVATLNAIVVYHVSPGAQTAATINANGSITTLGGEIGATELPTLTDAEPDLIDPSLIAVDIMADNGVLHVIDRVLLPIDLPGNDAPSITGIVASSGQGFDSNNADFDILLEAVKTAGLAETLDSEAVDFTVFAPTDAAFVGLAQALGYGLDDEAGAWTYLVDALTLLGGGDALPLLTQVLTYHVSPTSLQASQVLSAGVIDTLQGGQLTVDGLSLVDADPDIANPNLIATDIQASNGVVHVIDGVLLPADLLASNGANDVDFIIGDNGRDREFTGADNDFISTLGGRDLVFAGSGNDTVLLGNGRDKAFGGSGDDLIDGGNGRDKIFGGSGDDIVKGGNGRDYLNGGSGDDMIDGGNGRDVILAGSGNDTVDTGAGRDKVWLGWGHDTFVFNEGDGRDQIRDFNVHQDVIDLTDFGLHGLGDIHVSRSWHATRLDFGEGDSITLNGVWAGSLTEENFIL
ncbi:MAG: fasciclin domain-containing protein [Pseudomonadota bacterium]